MPLSAIEIGLLFPEQGFCRALTFLHTALLREISEEILWAVINSKVSNAMTNYTCFFHGAVQPNPGHVGLGVVVLDQNGVEIITASVNGGKGTNNVGAYKALILAFELCKDAGLERVQFYGDSQVVINQVIGEWVVNQETLLPLHAKAQELGSLIQCKLGWIKKTANKRACELSLSAIGATSDTIRYIERKPGLMQGPEHESYHEQVSSDEMPDRQDVQSHQRTSDQLEAASTNAAIAKHKQVVVKGLSGGKVAFVYGQDVVIFDLIAHHCTCSHFKIIGSCEHEEAVGRVNGKKAS